MRNGMLVGLLTIGGIAVADRFYPFLGTRLAPLLGLVQGIGWPWLTLGGLSVLLALLALDLLRPRRHVAALSGSSSASQPLAGKVDGAPVRDFLVMHFSDGELHNLCFDLNIPYDDLPGTTRVDKARELVGFVQRHRRGLELERRCRELRPLAPWPVNSEAVEASAVIAQPRLRPTPQARRYRHNYLRRLIDQHRYFETKGIAAYSKVHLDQERIFVKLTLARNTPKDMKRGLVTLQTGNHTIWDYLNAEKMGKFAICGAPGSGKTTLLRHIALRCALRKPWQLRPRLFRSLPVLLLLKDHAESIRRNIDISLAEVIQASLRPWGMEAPDGWFERELGRGGCIVLFDGLDEVADSAVRHLTVEWIERQMTIFARNYFIVSSRPGTYRDRPLEHVQVLEVCPFNREQVNSFIESWYRETEVRMSQRNDRGAPLRAKIGAQDLRNRLDKTPALNELTANPLLLTMIVTIHFHGNTLPGRRVDLYANICEVLLGNRSRAIGVDLGRSLVHIQKQSVLQPLAYEMMQSRLQSISAKQAAELIREPLAEITAQMTGKAFLEYIAESSDLLIATEGGRSYEFAHKTFQEYLAATFIREQRIGGELVAFIEDDWWEETILLFVAIARTHDSSPIIEACIEENRPSAHALSLAMKCLLEGAAVRPELRMRAEALFRRMVQDVDPQKRKTAAEALLLNRLSRMIMIVADMRQIDRTLITNAEYQMFLDEKRQCNEYFQPDYWTDLEFPSGQGDLPVVGVRRPDAEAFCAWLSERESEWVYKLPQKHEHAIPYSEMELDLPIGYWVEAESGDSGFVSSNIDLQHTRNVLLGQFDASIATLQLMAFAGLMQRIREAAHELLATLNENPDYRRSLTEIGTIGGDLGQVKALAMACRNLNAPGMHADLCYLEERAQQAFSQCDQAIAKLVQSNQARDQARRTVLVAESDRLIADVKLHVRTIADRLASRRDLLKRINEQVAAHLQRSPLLEEQVKALLGAKQGLNRDLVRALATVGQTTREAISQRAHSQVYIYNLNPEVLKRLAVKRYFPLDHVRALDCIDIFNRSTTTLVSRRESNQVGLAYLRYWSLLCCLLLDYYGANSVAQQDQLKRIKIKPRDAASWLSNARERCYGLFIDTALIECRLARDLPPVEGIRIARERRS